MHVAVCIVSFRNARDVAGCLAALARSTHADFEVVVCENGGAEAFAALEAQTRAILPGGQPVRRILAAGNLGYAGGVNVCLAAAPAADAWWVLNPDTEADPDAMAALLRRLAVGDCDLIGGTVHSPEGRVESRGGRWWPRFARSASIGFGEPLDGPVDAGEVERLAAYVSGACMLVSRRFLDAVGPMREDYFLYCEEVEWCLRGQARGLRLGYAPDARVLHHKGTTTGSVSDWKRRPKAPVYLDERNKILLTRDLFGEKLPVAALAALAILTLRFGKRRAWRQLGYAFEGWFAGLANRRGAPAWLRP
jgi:N-acetylglucosaminyl-diphospho-decaprenol L-rhamnosyltransferase